MAGRRARDAPKLALDAHEAKAVFYDALHRAGEFGDRIFMDVVRRLHVHGRFMHGSAAEMKLRFRVSPPHSREGSGFWTIGRTS